MAQGRRDLREVDVAVPAGADLSGADGAIEACCASLGLTLTVKTTLRMHTDNVHWHFKKGKERGTLEVTLLRAERKVVISVHDNRNGPWIPAAVRELKAAIVKSLRG